MRAHFQGWARAKKSPSADSTFPSILKRALRPTASTRSLPCRCTTSKERVPDRDRSAVTVDPLIDDDVESLNAAKLKMVPNAQVENRKGVLGSKIGENRCKTWPLSQARAYTSSH